MALVMIGLGTPTETLQAPRSGAEAYAQYCADCHGRSGEPEFPDLPDFRRGEGLNGSDLDIARRLRDGIGAHPMYDGTLSEEELLEVARHLRRLRR